MSTGFKSTYDLTSPARGGDSFRSDPESGKNDAPFGNGALSGGDDFSSGDPRVMVEDRRAVRKKTALIGGLLAIVFIASACFTTSTPPVISPIELFQVYGTELYCLWMSLTDPAHVPAGSLLIEAHPTYYWTLTNSVITFAYLVCGGMLALAGVLYQNIFRNPIASPSMLGVSSGVQLGVAALIILFGTSAGAMLGERYVFCFIAVTVVLLLLFGFAQLMGGKGRPLNVPNMLVVGVILNQFVGVIVTYLTWFYFDDEELDVFLSLTTMVEVSNDPLTWGILLVAFAIAVVPVILLRFRMNALNFSPAEMRMFGVNGRRLQLLALLFGTVVMVVAQVQVGMVAMITLVVPHLARAVYGSEFRKQLLGTMLIGAIVLVLCHIISLVLPYPGDIPIGLIVDVVLLPAFVWLMAVQQRGWD